MVVIYLQRSMCCVCTYVYSHEGHGKRWMLLGLYIRAYWVFTHMRAHTYSYLCISYLPSEEGRDSVSGQSGVFV